MLSRGNGRWYRGRDACGGDRDSREIVEDGEEPVGVDDVEAMLNVQEIARSSPRLEALICGPADYSASKGMDSGVIEGDLDAYPGDPWHYARNKIAIAARAAGIDAIDGAYPDFKNLDG